MRILITGAAGFLGSHLSDRFLAEGHDVIGMDNLITGARENLAQLKDNRRFSFVLHDVSRYIQVDGPVDGVLHFASPASPIDYLDNAEAQRMARESEANAQRESAAPAKNEPAPEEKAPAKPGKQNQDNDNKGKRKPSPPDGPPGS